MCFVSVCAFVHSVVVCVVAFDAFVLGVARVSENGCCTTTFDTCMRGVNCSRHISQEAVVSFGDMSAAAPAKSTKTNEHSSTQLSLTSDKQINKAPNRTRHQTLFRTIREKVEQHHCITLKHTRS